MASRLQLKIDDKQKQGLAKRSTSSPQAYEFYLKGLFRMDQLFAKRMRRMLGPPSVSLKRRSR